MKKMKMRLSVCLQGQKNMNGLNMKTRLEGCLFDPGVLVHDVPLTRRLGS